MALPTPPSCFEVPDFNQNRGAVEYDTRTKSFVTNPEVQKSVIITDVCGDPLYQKSSGTVTVNTFVDCKLVMAGSASMSFIMPVGSPDYSMGRLHGALFFRLLRMHNIASGRDQFNGGSC